MSPYNFVFNAFNRLGWDPSKFSDDPLREEKRKKNSVQLGKHPTWLDSNAESSLVSGGRGGGDKEIAGALAKRIALFRQLFNNNSCLNVGNESLPSPVT